MNETTVSLTAGDMLAIIERGARELAAWAAQPQAAPSEALRAITRLYAFTEKLEEMYQAAEKAKQDAALAPVHPGAGSNGASAAAN